MWKNIPTQDSAVSNYFWFSFFFVVLPAGNNSLMWFLVGGGKPLLAISNKF